MVALLLLLAAVLDATFHEEITGQETYNQFRDNQAEEDRTARDRSVPGLASTAATLGKDPFKSRFSLYLILSHFEANPRVQIDNGIPRDEVVDHLFLSMGGVGSVVHANVDRPASLPAEPTASGEYRFGEWRLYSTAEAADFVVFRDGNVTNIVDVSLIRIEGAATSDLDSEDLLFNRRKLLSWQQASVTDMIFFAASFGLGLFFVPVSRRRNHSSFAIALLVGMSLLALVAMLSVFSWFSLALAALLGFVGIGQTLTRKNLDLDKRIAVLIFLFLLTLVVIFARRQTFIFFTPDSWQYWSIATVSTAPQFRLQMYSMDYSPGLALLHTYGAQLGAGLLQSLGAVLLFAAAWLLLSESWDSPIEFRRWTFASGIIIVCASVVSPQVQTFAAYLHPNLLVSVLLLSLLQLVLHSARDNSSIYIENISIYLLVFMTVIARAEGALLVFMLALGTSATEINSHFKRTMWSALGASALAWGSILLLSGVQPATLILVAVGLASVVSFFLIRVTNRNVWVLGIKTVISVLWISLVPLLLGDRGHILKSLRANMLDGLGGWGVFGLAAAMLLFFVSLRLIFSNLVLGLHWPALALIVGFPPLALLARAASEPQFGFSGGVSRVGWGDSANRMWIHIFFVLLYMWIVLQRDVEFQDMHSVRTRRDFRAVQFAVTLISLPLAWNGFPSLINVRESQAVVSGTNPIGEMTTGSAIDMSFSVSEVPGFNLSDETILETFCVDVQFVTFNRVNFGELELRLQHGSLISERILDAADIEDWGFERICLDGHTGPIYPSDMANLSIASLSGDLGRSVSLLEATDSYGLGAARVTHAGRSTNRFFFGLAGRFTYTEAPEQPLKCCQTASLILWALAAIFVFSVLQPRWD